MISATSFVYVIGSSGSPQKVGSSGSSAHRAYALKEPGQPVPPVYFELQVRGADRYGIEKLAHHILSTCAIGRERFDCEPELAAQAVRDAATRYAEGERAPSRRPDAKRADDEARPACWKRRARNAGLSQIDLARLLGRPVNTISRQIRGLHGGVPQHLIAAIVAWEMLTPAQREEWIAVVEKEAVTIR